VGYLRWKKRSRRRWHTANSLRLTASCHFRLQIDPEDSSDAGWLSLWVSCGLLASEEPVQTIQSEVGELAGKVLVPHGLERTAPRPKSPPSLERSSSHFRAICL